MTTTFSVITPTLGRPSLKTMLDGLLPQLGDGDEALVVGDGPQPNGKTICDAYKSPLVTYYEVPFTGNFGNPARNDAIQKAKASRIFFVDDDDIVLPNIVGAMRKVCDRYPDRPIVFRMHHELQGLLYRVPKIIFANLSGQMFVPPNVKGRLGRWSGKYGADFDFIQSTLALYPEREKAVVFRHEIIVRMGHSGTPGVVLP